MDNKTINLGIYFLKDYPKYLELVDQCFVLEDLIEQNLQNKEVGYIKEDIFKFILKWNFYKAKESFLSIILLIDYRLMGDAQVIARKLFETKIHMNYITLDKNKRASQYWYYMSLEAKKITEQKISNDIESESTKEIFKKLLPIAEKNEEDAKVHFGLGKKEKIPNKFNKNWAGVDLRKMAEDCDMEFDYQNCYKLFSMATHAGVSSILNYIDIDEKNNKRNFKTSTALKVFLESVRCYCNILEILIKEYNLDLIKSLNQVKAIYNSFKNDPSLDDNSNNP